MSRKSISLQLSPKRQGPRPGSRPRLGATISSLNPLTFPTCSIVGFVILAAVESNGAKYFAAFMITCGIYPNVPQGVAWNGNNIGGSLKRGVGIAMHVGFVS